jgi:large subunit ribosomal protein L3
MGREPGSIGSSAYPSRVIKGKRLPGRMGGKSLTTKNLLVAGVDAEQNVLLVRGAIPGPTNGLVFVLKRG